MVQRATCPENRKNVYSRCMGMDRAGRWAALKVARRLAKSIPVVGTLVAVGFLAHSVRRKGVVGGVVHSTLDAIPFVGFVKNGIELFTDDLIPDRPPALPVTPSPSGNALYVDEIPHPEALRHHED